MKECERLRGAADRLRPDDMLGGVRNRVGREGGEDQQEEANGYTADCSDPLTALIWKRSRATSDARMEKERTGGSSHQADQCRARCSVRASWERTGGAAAAHADKEDVLHFPMT